MNTSAVGKQYSPSLYLVGREKVREYAESVGETEPLHLDLDAARAAGHADLVAPPMFAAVYSRGAVLPALLDPTVGIDFAHMVHGAQEFEWGALVIAGDEVSTVANVKSMAERGGMNFFILETLSCNQRRERVCRGTWTHIVRRPR
jgi:acyl dehydratase